MKRAIGAIWLFSLCICGYSQPADTTLVLPEFEKLEFKFEQTRSLALVSNVDSNTVEFNQGGSITDLLESATTLFVRNYGPGYSVGVSQRGLATSHTPIYWQGLNLNSPTTGLGDVSLIPAAFIQSMAIIHGGASAATGSGTIAGGIFLNPNNDHYSEGIFVSLESRMNSTQNLENVLVFKFLKSGWKLNTTLVNNHSQNRFNYVNHAQRDKPIEQRENCTFIQRGWLQELEKQIGKHSLSLALWGVETQRQLAPGLTSSDNQERQSDLNIKAVLTANLNYKNLDGEIQTGWLKDELKYSNGSGIQSEINSQQWLLNADFQQKIARTTVLTYGSNNSYQRALAGENYQNEVQQLALSVYAGLNQEFWQNRLNLNLVLRQEYYQHFQTPFSPALTLNFSINKGFSIFARASRNYRIPGLNDRFWMPGGNPNLPAERAWVAELGPEFNFLKSKGKNELTANVFGFLHQIENWIQWVPGVDYWRAVSYKAVRSYGLQSELNWNIILKSWRLNAKISHIYLNTKNLKSSFNNQIEGLTLAHVPAHKVFGNFSFMRKKTVLLIDGNYTGSRFISADNRIEQPAFMLFNVGVGQNFQFKKIGAALKFRVHNILNADYQVMPWMPMPLRYYSISLQINYKSNQKS